MEAIDYSFSSNASCDISAVQLIVLPDDSDEYRMHLLNAGKLVFTRAGRKNPWVSISLQNLPEIRARIVAADVETDHSMRAHEI